MKNTRLFVAISLLAAAVACNKNEIVETGYGSLEMDMSISGQTKAYTEDELMASAVVNIYMDNYGGLVRSYSYSDIPSPFYLKAGDYRIDVLAGEGVAENPVPASWENKSYKGSEEVTIVANQTQSVVVTAYVDNAVSNITLDQTVADNFNPGYTFTIGLDEEDASTQLVYTQDKSGSDGYFIVKGIVAPSFSWTFSGTLAKDGSTFTKSGKIADIEPGKRYNMNLKYTIKDGDLSLSLLVETDTEDFDDVIIFEPVSTGLAASSIYEIWATRATLHADVDAETAEGATIQFSYSKDGVTWTDQAAVLESEGAYKADLTGLTPSTEYSYKLIINGEVIGDAMTFTTEAAPNLPNASFEYTSLVTGESYWKFYDPNCAVPECQTMFWGSGNGEGPDGVNGSANMGIVITDVVSDCIDGKQAIVAQTSQMSGILAAGNLFTGQFRELVGTEGGIVNFGRPWPSQSRPTAMKVWLKYSTGKVDIIPGSNSKTFPDGVTLTKGSDYDRAQVKVAIGTWNYKDYKDKDGRTGTKDSPVLINTTDPNTFVDYNTDPSTIANGDIIIYNDGYKVGNNAKVTATTTGWVQYEIPLTYHNLNAYPTHIVVSFASSQYGDYFIGCSSAKLWIDKVELVY